jgi:hypothetical protein
VPGPADLTREQFARWWRETGELELRQILFWRWDPPGVVALLRAGASEDDLADHLGFVERETMLLSSDDPDRRAEVAQLLASWFGNSVARWHHHDGSA